MVLSPPIRCWAALVPSRELFRMVVFTIGYYRIFVFELIRHALNKF